MHPATNPQSINQQLVTSGHCTVVSDLPVAKEVLQDLEALCSSVPFVTSPSSGGSHFGLRRNNGIANLRDDTAKISELLLDNPELLALFAKHFGERVCVTNAQINRTSQWESLRPHSHGLEDRFAVLHFGADYTGGRYFEIDPTGFKHYPAIPPYSLVLNKGDVVHGVEEVTSTTPRIVVVMFLEPARRGSR